MVDYSTLSIVLTGLGLIAAIIYYALRLNIAEKTYRATSRRLVTRGGTFNLTVQAGEKPILFHIKGKGTFDSLEFSTTYKYHSRVELRFISDGVNLSSFTMEELRNSEWWKGKLSTSDSTHDFQGSYAYSFARERYLQLINPTPSLVQIIGKYTYSVYE